MVHPNQICYRLWGRYALYSDPITRLGGEKLSYQVPTYQALKGITESIYWKPTIIWYIDRVRILNPIRTQSKGMRPIHYQNEKNDLAIYTYLHDVAYEVEAHFEWNENRPDLAGDRNEDKHYQIAKHMVERGGRRDIFLGVRECQGYVEPCTFGEAPGFYDTLDELSFGLMFHSFSYPDESGEEMLRARFWRPVMQHGVITFTRPEDCTLVRDVRKIEPKVFIPGQNFSGCDALAREVGLE